MFGPRARLETWPRPVPGRREMRNLYTQRSNDFKGSAYDIHALNTFALRPISYQFAVRRAWFLRHHVVMSAGHQLEPKCRLCQLGFCFVPALRPVKKMPGRRAGQIKITAQTFCVSDAWAPRRPGQGGVFCLLRSLQSYLQTTPHAHRPQRPECGCRSGPGRSDRAK